MRLKDGTISHGGDLFRLLQFGLALNGHNTLYGNMI